MHGKEEKYGREVQELSLAAKMRLGLKESRR